MLKKIFITLAILAVFGFILFQFFDEDIPQGQSGPEAEALADKMLSAINFNGWENTNAVKWHFYRGHDFIWDKKRNLVSIKWDDKHVLFNTRTKDGLAYADGKKLEGEHARELLKDAWSHFANDSFWLAAPFKIRDPGTQRYLVKTGSGDALLVKYASGGVTPGDSYLWILDDNGRPIGWKLWVSIIPIGGMQFTWENWKQYDPGVQLASLHAGIIDVEVTGIETATDAAQFNNGTDPFADL